MTTVRTDTVPHHLPGTPGRGIRLNRMTVCRDGLHFIGSRPLAAIKDHLRLAGGLALLGATLLLSACGGGGGGGLSGDDQSVDPGAVEYPIAYIRRPVPEPDEAEPNNLQDPFAFQPGGRLFVRSRADGDAPEINVADVLFPEQTELYDVKDLTVSPDGKLLAFALHAPMIENADPIDQPSWDIYVYNFATRELKPMISSKNRAEGNDVAPQFLDDGSIVFVSDRQTRSRELLASSGSPAYSGAEESRQRKAGVLHVMNEDGNDIRQVSFNQSHDLSPSLLRNGKLVFTRWDNMAGNNGMNLYTMNPSGMGLSLLYGYHSHDTGSDPGTAVQFSQPREMEDGRLATILRPYQSVGLGGDLVAIDTTRFTDNDQPVWEHIGLAGPAQQSLAANPVLTDNDPTRLSPGGEFGAVWPLFDGTNRLLVSWSQCRALDEDRIVPCATAPADALPAPLLYGIWIFDANAGTQKPIVTPREGVIFTDIVAASPAKTIVRQTDPVAGTATNDLLDFGNNILAGLTQTGNEMAVLDIRSVYNLDGHASADIIAQSDPSNPAYTQYQARFLQIVQAVPIPANNEEINDAEFEVPNFAFGASSANLMRQIVGYVPIEPDGSVVVQVPADVPLTFNILDADAKSISPRHSVWWQFRSGEVLRCTGCHDNSDAASEKLPHGRMDSVVTDINPGSNSANAYPIANPALLTLQGTRAGQSLAQIYAANRQPRKPSLNVLFFDEWAANPAHRKNTIDARYVNDDPAQPRQVPVNPVSSDACLANWNARCRIVINYDEHIQPIWEKSRPVVDGNNVVIGDNRCNSCHAATDANGAAQVPAGQLELTGAPSAQNANIKTSYQELFNGDTQRDIAGVPIPLLDGNNTPVLDEDGNPVFRTVGRVMTPGSARGSGTFFACMTRNECHLDGVDPAVAPLDHTDLLTRAELRLLSEWLDIGAQYYNDVVKAVQAGQ
jgi:hypothetical protein